MVYLHISILSWSLLLSFISALASFMQICKEFALRWRCWRAKRCGVILPRGGGIRAQSQLKGQSPSSARASGSCSTESVAEFLDGVLLSRTIRSINQAY